MGKPNDLNFSITRRGFILGTAAIAAAPASGLFPSAGFCETALKAADYQEKLEDGRVRCLLCPHACAISEGKRGVCRVRENRKGTLYSLSYGRPCSMHVDPIEKKPFFHFLPGTLAFSISTVGCNMTCKFCQNWQISELP
jgi:pyruvate formate lyase activating enzyme